jgi:hypothetical protein
VEIQYACEASMVPRVALSVVNSGIGIRRACKVLRASGGRYDSFCGLYWSGSMPKVQATPSFAVFVNGGTLR